MAFSKIRRYSILALIAVFSAAFFYSALLRLEFDSDIINSLPDSDPVVRDAAYIFKHHPVKDRVVVDVSSAAKDMDYLLEAAGRIEKEILKSGLFKHANPGGGSESVSLLMDHAVLNLPVLFSKAELEKNIAPLLSPENVEKKFSENITMLSGLSGIAMGRYIAPDPLAFRNPVLKKLALLNPSEGSQIYGSRIFSGDGKHCLIIAEPGASGTDTVAGGRIVGLLNGIALAEKQKSIEYGNEITVRSTGAFRAAYDNETIARKDTGRALALATAGIAFLLLLVFPRPLLSLFSFLPAVFGTLMGLGVYSLFFDRISMLAMGFGGAVISITIDHGIAYLLFLDQPRETQGNEAAGEIRFVGMLAAFTSMGAFGALYFSGFEIMAQIGIFASLGVFFSFIFVHTVFPLMFPSMPPAKRDRPPFVYGFIKLISSSGRRGFIAGAAFFLVMLFFAQPVFEVNLNSMNTVSESAREDEEIIKGVWGDVLSPVYMLTEGGDITTLQEKTDEVSGLLREDMEHGIIGDFFSPGSIFPGRKKAEQNLAAWKEFWSAERVRSLKQNINRYSMLYGFSPEGFSGFFESLEKPAVNNIEIPEALFGMLGISGQSGAEKYYQFITLKPSVNYKSGFLYEKYSSAGLASVFDSAEFSSRLGHLLKDTFIRMLFIIGSAVFILLLVFYRSFKLTCVTLMPVLFALVCTIGTMNIFGKAIDIPGLMLAIIIIGMGVDYSIYFVRSYQRYGSMENSSLIIIKTAVFLASFSTMIGFGVMLSAEHSLLNSAGFTSLLGIGYSLAGTFILLPYLLPVILKPRP